MLQVLSARFKVMLSDGKSLQLKCNWMARKTVSQSSTIFGIQQMYGYLTDTWMPNRHQHKHENLCQPSCNNSLTITDTTTLMTPWMT